ncbi:Mor transcription activator family protein [Burkholderia sp. LMG 21824]|uniref:Mor transcription activator family protein n=1 Tax=Burkholderia sp. LMG 21824 TaxID=3158172 RepID=UPI003C2D2029
MKTHPFTFPLRYPELLEQLAATLFHEMKKAGVQEESASRISLKAVDEIRQVFGGVQYYIPRADYIDKGVRNKLICAEFDGTNLHELSRKYRLSDQQIRTILSRGLEADRDK